VCALTAWPEFHNGVAAGLRIAPAFNQRPWSLTFTDTGAGLKGQLGQQLQQQQQQHSGSSSSSSTRGGGGLRVSCLGYTRAVSPSYYNAGMLMALGLTGDIEQLSFPEVYR
jgi:hypothetical protein